jgi:hypothetical protein
MQGFLMNSFISFFVLDSIGVFSYVISSSYLSFYSGTESINASVCKASAGFTFTTVRNYS